VLRTNAHRRAIVVTHNFGNTQTPLSFSPQGAAIYNALKTNANLFLMLAGHVTGEGSRVDTYNGNVVRTFVQDFQGWTNGGNGFMRTFEFSPSNNMVIVQTFSPWTGEYETDDNSEFFFNYDMQSSPGSPGTPITVLATNTGVASGGTASTVWSGLNHGKTYEWHVVLTDESGDLTVSPTWRFTTAPNVAPVASNKVVTITGDALSNLDLNLGALDANNDPLTFATNSFPMHGSVPAFNTNSGIITYQPIHGYRGSDRFVWRASDGEFNSSWVTMNLNIVAPADTNANNLPDTWESAYGVTEPQGDADGDGQTNLEEYFANTNPTNATSTLRITSATRSSNGHVTLQWSSVGGTRYRVQYDDGNAGGSFDGLFNEVMRPLNAEIDPAPYGMASTQSFLDDLTQTGGSATNRARYYRIKVVQ